VSTPTPRNPLLCRLDLHDKRVRSSTDGYLYYRKYWPDCGEVAELRAELYKGELTGTTTHPSPRPPRRRASARTMDKLPARGAARLWQAGANALISAGFLIRQALMNCG
jgi:hypothetical protein